MRAEHADAALLLSSPLTFPNRFLIAKSALDARVPSMAALREYTAAGALMSYGPSYADHCRRAADFVHQIVNGAKPGDLPVQQPTRLSLVINLTTANALGLDLPPSFLANADESIQNRGVIRLLLAVPGHRSQAGSPDSVAGRRPQVCRSARLFARRGRAARSLCSSTSAAPWSCAWPRSH